MPSLKFDPKYGNTLTIDGEVASDEAIIHVNGNDAVAYAYSFETGNNEIVGRLTNVDGQQDKRSGHEDEWTLTGEDFETGVQRTWKVGPGRPCTSC